MSEDRDVPTGEQPASVGGDPVARRHGKPHGPHGKPPDMSAYLRDGDPSELAEMIREMKVGASPHATAAKSRLDLTINLPTMLAIFGMLLGGIEWINTQSNRVDALENGQKQATERAAKYVPMIEKLTEGMQGQEDHNKMQEDRVRAQADAIVDERKARQEDAVENRRVFADIEASIAKLAEKVSDIGTDVAVIKAGGHRSDAGAPEHDANLAPLRR